MLVIRRVMGRNRKRKSRMFAAMPAQRERFALHHRHLMLVLMDPIMHYVVDSGSGTKIAGLELIHNIYARAGRKAPWAAGAWSGTCRRGGVASSSRNDPAKHNPAMV
jgi:hypothetical protein